MTVEGYSYSYASWYVTCVQCKNTILFVDYENSEMCSLLNKLALAIKRENLSVIRDENKKETILKTVLKLVNTSADDELTVHVLLVLLQVCILLIYKEISSTYINDISKSF